MAPLRALLLAVVAVSAAALGPEWSGRFRTSMTGPERKPRATVITSGIEVPAWLRARKWTFIALLGVRQQDDTVRWLCGGSLLSSTHVLTAAHCVATQPTERLVVRLGETRLGTTVDGEHVERSVVRVAVHPQRLRLQHDLAVLTLSAAVPQVPARLGTARPGQRAEVAGWGLTEFGGRPSPVLLEAAVTLTDAAECERRHLDGAAESSLVRQLYPGGFGGRVLCAADLSGGGRDACRADSGGPLAVGAAGRQRLVGVISSGRGCGDSDLPGLYTDLSKFTDWIAEQLKPAEGLPSGIPIVFDEKSFEFPPRVK